VRAIRVPFDHAACDAALKFYGQTAERP